MGLWLQMSIALWPSFQQRKTANQEIIPKLVHKDHIYFLTITYEPPRGKTNNVHRRKQRRRSASR